MGGGGEFGHQHLYSCAADLTTPPPPLEPKKASAAAGKLRHAHICGRGLHQPPTADSTRGDHHNNRQQGRPPIVEFYMYVLTHNPNHICQKKIEPPRPAPSPSSTKPRASYYLPNSCFALLCYDVLCYGASCEFGIIEYSGMLTPDFRGRNNVRYRDPPRKNSPRNRHWLAKRRTATTATATA